MSAGPRYNCALITGASSGLGEEFALQLAPHCRRMVLVARRQVRLRKLEITLQGINPGVEVGSVAADLSREDQRAELIARFEGTDWVPTLLVNNAGMGDFGEFVTADWEKLNRTVQLNVAALTHLAHGFLPAMIAAGHGAIINVSSLAGHMPVPDFAVYAATKSYVTNFSEALRMEVREKGISVLTTCPGPVATEFGKVARRTAARPEDFAARDWFAIDREQVVSETLAGLANDRARVYPGWKVALLAAGLSLVPLALLRAVMSNRPRRDKSEKIEPETVPRGAV